MKHVYTASSEVGVKSALDPSYYCARRCPSHWVGDGWCDRACSVAACAFDAADCGSHGSVDVLTLHPLQTASSHQLASNTTALRLNLTRVWPAWKRLQSAVHDGARWVQTAVVSTEQRMMTLLLFSDAHAAAVESSLAARTHIRRHGAAELLRTAELESVQTAAAPTSQPSAASQQSSLDVTLTLALTDKTGGPPLRLTVHISRGNAKALEAARLATAAITASPSPLQPRAEAEGNRAGRRLLDIRQQQSLLRDAVPRRRRDSSALTDGDVKRSCRLALRAARVRARHD